MEQDLFRPPGSPVPVKRPIALHLIMAWSAVKLVMTALMLAFLVYMVPADPSAVTPFQDAFISGIGSDAETYGYQDVGFVLGLVIPGVMSSTIVLIAGYLRLLRLIRIFTVLDVIIALQAGCCVLAPGLLSAVLAFSPSVRRYCSLENQPSLANCQSANGE